MTKDERMDFLAKLVDEVTREAPDPEKVKQLTAILGIPFSDEPMQLLNNVLKGIHSEGPIYESNT